MTAMTIHGGVRFAGADPEVANFELEHLAVDPIAPNVGRMWVNSTEKVAKYVSSTDQNGKPVITSVLGDIDYATLYTLMSNKANSATTLAGYGITDAVADNDPRFNYAHTKIVRKTAAKNQYTSIAAALNSITDASATNPYLVQVDAGVFNETNLAFKPYVMLQGAGELSTIITCTGVVQDLITAAPNSGISQVTLTGASNFGQALVGMNDPDASATQVFRMTRIRFGAAETLVRCVAGYVTVSTSNYGEKSSFKYGFIAKNDDGRSAIIALRSCSTNGMTTPFPEVLYEADGTSTQILLVGTMARAGSTITGYSAYGVGIHLRNGGRIRGAGNSLVGFNKGLWAENAGAPTRLECEGFTLSDNAWDLVIDHPAAYGSFHGSARRTHSAVNPAVTSLSVLYVDLEGGGFVNVGPMYVGDTHATLANIEPLISRGMQIGLLDGGLLTRGTGLSVVVAAGSGYVQINGALRTVQWPTQTIPVQAGATQYVSAALDGTVTAAVTQPDPKSNVILGRLLAGANSIILIGDQGALNIEEFNPNLDKLLRQAVGPIFVSGCQVTENPSIPRALNITTGHYFYSTKELFPGPAVAPTLLAVYHIGGVASLTPWTVLDNANYDNGLNLVPLPAGKYTKHVLYSNGDAANVAFFVGVGDTAYDTADAAALGPNPAPLITPGGTPIIATIIVQQGNNHIVQIYDERPRLAFAAHAVNGVVNHGDLLNLDADDHKQYLLANGTRKMVGSLDMGNNALVNVSSIDGLDVTQHAARHLPNGADPLVTAAPRTSLSAASINSAGTDNSLARSDHTHQITGFQPSSGELTALASLTYTGFARRTGTNAWSTTTLAPLDIPPLDYSKIVSGKPTTLTGYGITDAVSVNQIGVANGVASLDASGKLTIAQIPASLVGALVYQGVWDASVNSPQLTSGLGVKGQYYKVAASGSTSIDGQAMWVIGDMIVFDGTTWDRIEGGDATEVTSVAGRVGAVVLTAADISGLALSATLDTTSASNITKGTLPGAQLPAFTGDVVTPGNTAAMSLSTTGILPGTYGSSTAIPVFTVDSKGRLTSGSSTLVAAAWNNITGRPSTISGYGIVDAFIGNTAIAGGTGTKVTYDSKGLVTGSSALAAADIPSLDYSKIISGKPVTLAGYGITDAINVNKLGVASGVATLDATGRLTTAQIPTALVGALQYQGTWNAATNTPQLASGLGTKGQYYKVSTAGSTTVDGLSQWNAGDMIVFDGVVWDKIDGLSSEVTTVAGRVGAVVLSASDVAGLAPSATVDTTNAINITSGTLPATRLPALSGDVVTAPGSAVVSLSNTGITPGAYGSGSTVPTFTVDARGRLTLAASVAVTPAWNNITSKPTTLVGYGITDAVAANTPVTATTGTKLSYDAKGLVTGSTVLVAADIPNLDYTKITSGKPTTIAGYGITDAVTSVAGRSGAVVLAAADVGGLAPSATTDTTNASNITSGSLTVARLPALSGDASSLAGSGVLTLATIVSAGSASKVNFDAKGRITSTTSLVPADIPNLDYSKIVSGKPTTLSGYGITDALAASQLGVASGVASLDASGKLSASQIPPALVGAVQYQGGWNPTSNTPALASGVGIKGQYYKVTISGAMANSASLDGVTMFYGGDMVIFNGTTWDKIDGAQSEVLTVAGRAGNVVLSSADISGLAPSATIDTTNATNITSGTLPVGRLPAHTGDATSTAGSAALTFATVITAGTATKVTFDAKGRVVGTSLLVATDIPNLDYSKITTGKPTTLSGYGITDAIVNTVAGRSGAVVLAAADVSGLAPSATIDTTNAANITSGTLLAARMPAHTGDVTSTVGTVGLTLASVVTAGSAAKITYDAKGRVTAGAALVAADIPALDYSKITTGKPTTIAGYGITDAIVNTVAGRSGAVVLAAGDISGLAASATTDATNAANIATGTLPVARLPAFTGDASTLAGGSAITLATVTTAGTFPKITFDAKGRVTSGTALVAADIPALDYTKITTGKPTTLSGYGITDAINVSQIGVASGLATLDATGKLTTAQIPASLVGAMQYQGGWNPTTNTPALASGVGTKGQYYKVTTTGAMSGAASLDGVSQFYTGDLVAFDGVVWDKIDGAQSEVLTVAGRAGNVVLVAADIGGLAPSATIDTTNAANITSGILPPARMPARTGDVTSPAGSTVNTLATIVTPGTATKVTYDATGRVTAGAALVAADIPALDYSKITTGKPTTLGGYGITDAQPLSSELTAHANLATTGLVARTAAATIVARAITGTASQIVVANGDGVAGNPTFSLAADPVIPGNAGMVLPMGTMAQRGVSTGAVRYNNSNDQFEGNSAAGWVPFAGNNLITGIFTGLVPQQSGTTVMASSTAPPLATTGTLLFSKTITPSRTSSYFIIDFAGFVDTAGGANLTVNIAVFRDNVFVGMTSMYTKNTGQPNPFALSIVETPNTTNPVTYSVRIGMQSAGTWYIGRTAPNNFGGVNPTGWTITQVY